MFFKVNLLWSAIIKQGRNVTGKVLHRIIVLLVRFVLLARFGLLNFGALRKMTHPMARSTSVSNLGS